MSFRTLLPIVAITCMPFLGNAQTPNAAAVITDLIAYAKIPAPINPHCSYHVVNVSLTVTDNELSYSGSGQLFTGTGAATVFGSKVVYNTMSTSRLPLQLSEYSAGKAKGADRTATATFGWAGSKPQVLGDVTIALANGKTKTYALAPDLKVTTVASGNKYILSGTLLNGALVAIYLEKSAFSDCK